MIAGRACCCVSSRHVRPAARHWQSSIRQRNQKCTLRHVNRSLPMGVPQASGASTALAFLFQGIAPMCFDKACQAQADQAFIIAITIPVIVAVAAVSYLLRPIPKDLRDSGSIFEDPNTGAVFESPDGVQPDRDKQGELAFRPISYTPWPVASDYEGQRVRIDVGPINRKAPRTYVFNRVLSRASEIVLVTLPRPLGVVFEYDEQLKRASVAELIEGSHADQRRKMAALNKQLEKSAVLPGDVLRAVTCTNFVYPTKALFGAVPPQRHIVVYGADRQSWAKVRSALGKGVFKDGDVTLVLERASSHLDYEPTNKEPVASKLFDPTLFDEPSNGS